MESLDTRDSGWSVFSLNTNQVHILIQLSFSLLDGAGNDASSTRNVDSLVNGHEEFLIDFTNWLLESAVHGLKQLLNGLGTKLGVLAI